MRNFIEEVEDLEPIAPILPSLLTSIFHLMNEVDNEDLVFALEAIVDKFGERIAPYAIQMAQQLSVAFIKYANASGEDEDEDDVASMAAYGQSNPSCFQLAPFVIFDTWPLILNPHDDDDGGPMV